MTGTPPSPGRPLRVALVTGLSGGGKASILRALEDIGYEAVDNPPLTMIEEMVARTERPLAIGVDARTRGFDAGLVLEALQRVRENPALRTELVFVWADEATLLRRYTETRRRHPLAPRGRVTDGIAAEQLLTAPLRELADLIIDTSELPLPALRQKIERHFGTEGEATGRHMVVSLMSFAYAHGLPQEADLVFDARFLRNPHYDPILGPRTGLDSSVGAYIAADPDYPRFFSRLAELIDLLLPRFVLEGKKYTTITIGCTGGRHRSVYLVEQLAAYLGSRIAVDPAGGGIGIDWQLNVTHRELGRDERNAVSMTDRPVPRRDGSDNGEPTRPSPVQAQEA
ncbi:MAG TPA: RNase adapter RapZ [Acetobacteraceae bacterium]|nr:RNase adapter RapZ [Acetobacteraceae bacterium]